VAAPSDHQDAGDAVLLRIEFQWEKRSQPVRRVSWFEASAYCRWRGGRLPSFEQRRALPENHLVHGALPEWCDDRCANNAQLRRTAHHYERCVAPDSKHLRLGFRLVLPPAQRRRTAR
jgi:formylglycine-generating enzyme required for sulfatase activity